MVHMNGRVYDPIIGRFSSADPITESPYSTQGWNRYAYVGNSPLNFTDPSGYCFMGCFWNQAFKAIGNVFRKIPILGSILQIAAGAVCSAIGGPGAGAACAAAASAFVTGVTSGKLGNAIRAGLITAVTAFAFNVVGDITLGAGHPTPAFGSEAHVANIAGHAVVGCASSVASGGKCGPGALSGAAGSFAAPLISGAGLGLVGGTAASAVAGGLASVAGGGKFANGAVTAAFGYLFNSAVHDGDQGRAPPTGNETTYCVPCIVPAGKVVGDGLALLAAGFYAMYSSTPDWADDAWNGNGNSLRSTRSTWVYQLNTVGVPDDVLKYGITSSQPPQTRYPQWYYRLNNAEMQPLELFPTRWEARQFEKSLCISYAAANNGALPPLSRAC